MATIVIVNLCVNISW